MSLRIIILPQDKRKKFKKIQEIQRKSLVPCQGIEP